MIRYSLICARQHSFESWFPNSAAFDRQARRGLVACPQCGSTKVEKAIMAPRIADSRRAAPGAEAPAAAPAAPDTPPAGTVTVVSPQEHALRAKLKELHEHLVKNADHVGARFPEEARKMHYGEIEYRSIYGEASLEQAKELAEEGIEFHPLPVLPDERN
jgi:hypothetical protein